MLLKAGIYLIKNTQNSNMVKNYKTIKVFKLNKSEL